MIGFAAEAGRKARSWGHYQPASARYELLANTSREARVSLKEFSAELEAVVWQRATTISFRDHSRS
jgi:hypothetical protein